MCKDCKHFKILHEPAIGECKLIGCTRLYNETCKKEEKTEIQDLFTELFGGFNVKKNI